MASDTLSYELAVGVEVTKTISYDANFPIVDGLIGAELANSSPKVTLSPHGVHLHGHGWRY